jgi:hypothetical protein
VVWSAIALGRIPVARQDNLRPEFLGPDQGAIKVLDFKPQQHPIPMSQLRISDRPMMMTHLPVVQLQDQLAIRNQLLVVASAVAALASQKTLIPTTARFNISNTNKGMWTHLPSGACRGEPGGSGLLILA